MPPVRILVDVPVDGVPYVPNQVVDFPASVVKSLSSAGIVDASAEAVAYCVDELGAQVIKHAKPVAPAESDPAAPAA